MRAEIRLGTWVPQPTGPPSHSESLMKEVDSDWFRRAIYEHTVVWSCMVICQCVTNHLILLKHLHIQYIYIYIYYIDIRNSFETLPSEFCVEVSHRVIPRSAPQLSASAMFDPKSLIPERVVLVQLCYKIESPRCCIACLVKRPTTFKLFSRTT